MNSTAQLTIDSSKKTGNAAMDLLFSKLEEAIDDMEKGKVQTIDEAWEEIDAI